MQRRLAIEDKFWDDLAKGYGMRPVRSDEECPNSRVSWRKTDLAAASEPDAARRFRDRWNNLWSGYYGHFEDTTWIRPMRYTDEPPLDELQPHNALQIFSVKISGLGPGFKWPLNVFGLVAIRDSVDRNRNIIFLRSRVESQTLTEKDPYLVLTGPSRVVVLSDPVTIEVNLKVKGPIGSEDRTLCFLAEDILCIVPSYSTATIFVRVINGSWPDGFHGQIAACTASFPRDGDEKCSIDGFPSVDHKEIVLCSFGAGEEPVIGDGTFELSRRVVSAQQNGMLKVSTKAWQDEHNVVEVVNIFVPKEAGRSFARLVIECCRMEVMVAWSLVSTFSELR
ncbi:hypothetical protein BS78_02G354000 [Paspalum vaginatum]|nr:hypothetical protein BS78_02G354000 [Paspalum vaginatum]